MTEEEKVMTGNKGHVGLPGETPTPMPARLPGSDVSVREYGVSDTQEQNSAPGRVPTTMRPMPGVGQTYPDAKRGARVSDISGGSAEATPGEPISDEEIERNAAVAGHDRQIKTISDWMEAEENRPETEEQRKKRERKERSKKIISAVSDGLSALSNLYFTSQYAPNMYSHERGSMMKATDARIERLKAEREKKRDAYMNFSLKLGGLENDRARTLRELEAQQEARKMAREKAKREEDLHPLVKAQKEAQARKEAEAALKAGYDAEYSRVKAENEPKRQQAELDRIGAQTQASKASAANSYASARAHSTKTIYGTFNGRTYDNQRDYDKAVRKAAEEYNKRHPMTRKVKRSEYDENGKPKEVEVDEPVDAVALTWKDRYGDPKFYEASVVAAKLEPLLREEAEADSKPPSRRPQADNKPPSRR